MIKVICLFAFGLFVATSAVVAQDKVGTEPLIFDKNLTQYDYPFDVEFYSFESQGQTLNMAYMYLPPKVAQMPVVTLMHGKNFNGAYWETTAKYLQAKGYGVLIPDQIGFGKSSKPVDYQYSFAALAHNTKGLMESLGIENAIIVGHSMGGMLASRFALLYPQMTNKLVLLNPIGLENYLNYVDYKDTEFFYQNELAQTPEKIVAYQKANYYDGQWNDDYASLTEPLAGWVKGNDWQDIAKVNALTYDMIFTQPVIEEFDQFEVSVSLIIGTRDRTGPGRNWKREGVTRELGRYDQLGAEVKARNSAINVIELEGLGHLPQIEDFDRFTTALDQALAQ